MDYMNEKIAAVGDRDSVIAFQALGIEAICVKDAEESAKAIFQLAKKGCAVIFITEQTAEMIPEMISRYDAQPYPAIIPIPSNQGGTGMGMAQLKKNVEKALGADILFGKEGSK